MPEPPVAAEAPTAFFHSHSEMVIANPPPVPADPQSACEHETIVLPLSVLSSAFPKMGLTDEEVMVRTVTQLVPAWFAGQSAGCDAAQAGNATDELGALPHGYPAITASPLVRV